jgi:hypothetical protein
MREKRKLSRVTPVYPSFFSLPSPQKTNSTVVPLSASSGSLVLRGSGVCVEERGVRKGENKMGHTHGENHWYEIFTEGRYEGEGHIY